MFKAKKAPRTLKIIGINLIDCGIYSDSKIIVCVGKVKIALFQNGVPNPIIISLPI